MEASLQSRKSSLRDAMQSMPPDIKDRVTLFDDEGVGTVEAQNNSPCVVCQDELAVNAVVPSGHVCLCSICSDVCMTGQSGPRHAARFAVKICKHAHLAIFSIHGR